MKKVRKMNKKIRVAVVGGNFGETHVMGFRHCAEIEIIAICRRQKVLAEQLAEKYQIPRFYTDFDEMIQCEDIDAVCLAVPNYLHYPMAMKALDRGKHIICEKPMALNIKEAAEMLEKADEKGLINMIVFNWRFVPAIMHMKELIERGEIGSVYHVFFSWLTSGRRNRESLFYWRFVKSEAGFGALGDTGVHGIDLIHWFFGDLTKVISHMSIHVGEHRIVEGNYKKAEVEDSCSFLGELAGGGQVIFHASSVALCDSMIRMEVHGSKGVLGFHVKPRAGDYTGKLFGGNGETSLRHEILLPERFKTDITPIYENAHPSVLFFARFAQKLVQGIQKGQPASPNFLDGLKVQKVLHALLSSYEKEKWVNVAT